MKKRNPVKKNMDKFHKPRTHKDKTKYDRKSESEKLQEDLEPIDKETEKFLDDLANNTPNIDQFEEKKETKKFPPKNSWGFTKK